MSENLTPAAIFIKIIARLQKDCMKGYTTAGVVPSCSLFSFSRVRCPGHDCNGAISGRRRFRGFHSAPILKRGDF